MAECDGTCGCADYTDQTFDNVDEFFNEGQQTIPEEADQFTLDHCGCCGMWHMTWVRLSA